jgi:SAM-dependent methyltransferase
MRNKELWTPTKYVKTERGYKPSKDPQMLGIGSRFVADILIKHYEVMIREHARGMLLDMGCGNIPYYEIYKDLVDGNLCVDWENSLHKNPFLDQLVDLNEKVPLESETFDTILLTDVLEHIAEPQLLMSEIARLLKPDGKVLIAVPFLYCLHEQPHDYYRYTEHALRRFCTNNDLTVISLTAYGGVPEVILDIVAKNIAFSRALSHAHLMVSTRLISLSFVRRVSSKTSRLFPLGYCLVARKNKASEKPV